jgi:hypothetical protein
LDRQLYPASWKDIGTVFTFQVLKVFNLLKVHAHMSTDQYSAILRRITNYAFPSKTPVRANCIRVSVKKLIESSRNEHGNSHGSGSNGTF